MNMQPLTLENMTWSKHKAVQEFYKGTGTGTWSGGTENHMGQNIKDDSKRGTDEASEGAGI